MQPLTADQITIYVNDSPVQASTGESLLGVLFALGLTDIAKTNDGAGMGAYCGMGICYCCTVDVDGVSKQRACQTIVHPDMRVVTSTNKIAAQRQNND